MTKRTTENQLQLKKMLEITKTRQSLPWATIAGAAFLLLGCAPKGVTPPSPPKQILPKPGTCPAAMPLQNVQVTLSAGESNFPEIIWDQKTFLVTWWDMRSTEPEIFVQGLDAEGFETRPARKIPSTGWAKNPSLAFDGIETHLVWREDPRILSARLGDGDPTIRTVSENGTSPDAGAWGGVVFVANGFLYFRSDGMIDLKNGAPMPPKIIAAGGIETPKIAYNGIYYAVIWSESVSGGRRIVLQRVSPRGEKFGGLVTVSSKEGAPRNPSIVWDGKRWAAAWTAGEAADAAAKNPFRLFFALIPEVGDTPIFQKSTTFKSASEQVAVATAGEEYALAWTAEKDNGGCGIYFQRLDANGEAVGATTELSDGTPQTCSRPSLVWDGKGYAAVWHDDRGHGESEIYFSYVACGDMEMDLPGPKTEAPKDSSPELPALKEAF